jgi:transcriptional activator SPT7
MMTKNKYYIEQTLKHATPPPFTKVTNPESFIGLLQPWYKKRLEDHPDLLEDEYLPRHRHRNRYPPLNKPMKRRVLKDGSNTHYSNEEKKKRKHQMEELKAERKRQKLELKAQKLAEKEQKKKEKEEQRLAKKR